MESSNMSGPQRKPTETALLSGSTRAKARAKTEPQPGFKIPDPPTHLSEAAREYWPVAVEAVQNLRCVTEADGIQLGILAQCLADWYDVVDKIATNGATAISEKGIEYASPHANRQQSVYTRLQNCLDRFGLNPSNRSKVTALPTKLGEIVTAQKEKKSRYAD